MLPGKGLNFPQCRAQPFRVGLPVEPEQFQRGVAVKQCGSFFAACGCCQKFSGRDAGRSLSSLQVCLQCPEGFRQRQNLRLCVFRKGAGRTGVQRLLQGIPEWLRSITVPEISKDRFEWLCQQCRLPCCAEGCGQPTLCSISPLTVIFLPAV